MREYFKTIVMSDIHLGSKHARSDEALSLLKNFKCDTLILNGDIIDGWQLKSGGRWKNKHTRFLNYVLKMTSKDNTSVVYIRGNHDDFLDSIVPVKVKNISIVRDYIYESCGKKFYVIHGDILDVVKVNTRWLTLLGEFGYKLIYWFNRRYNEIMRRNGLSYHSVFAYVGSKMRKGLNKFDDHEIQMTYLAKTKGCHGVICGHSHEAGIKDIDNLTYMNSGDWVDSMSALFEDHEGKWHIGHYAQSFSVRSEDLGTWTSHFPVEDSTEKFDTMEDDPRLVGILRKWAFGRNYPNIEHSS